MPLIQPYADHHINPQGPGDARPTARQIIEDNDLKLGLPDHVILITGCTSGIGVETARALCSTGAQIWITTRDMEKGVKVATELCKHGPRRVKLLEMNLDSFSSIRAAAKLFLEQEYKLNVLINNAGIMGTPLSRTEDGYESQFGTNHLGHHLLFQLLKPALFAAATLGTPSRVVSLSSSGHRLCDGLPLDDLGFSKSIYQPLVAYGRSKLANIHFANELNRRYKAHNLNAVSVHPGSIYTPLRRYVESQEFYKTATSDPAYQLQSKSVEQGAATTVWAAVGKDMANRGGVYLEDVGEADKASPNGLSWRPGYSEAAFDQQAEHALWEVSNELCEITD